MKKTKTMVLTGFGINCEVETKYAFDKNGSNSTIVHLNDLIENPNMLFDYQILALPGGFSFGDDISSGRVFANKIKTKLKEQIIDFIKNKNLIIGICNGFQILVKLGLVPMDEGFFNQTATLSKNSKARFFNKWVYLKINEKSNCIFTKGIDMISLPIRHGEGQFVSKNIDSLIEKNLHVMQYCDKNKNISEDYPICPNGSQKAIAGICNKEGNVFGLMPHPEANIDFYLQEKWTRKKKKMQADIMFKNANNYCLEKLI